MSDEKTYTLAEAQLLLSQKSCASQGHTFDVIVKFGGAPLKLTCTTCGRSWNVE